MGETVYKFRRGTQVPEGATPEGVMAERDLIEQRCGDVTVAVAANEVMRAPEAYPNLNSFCPQTVSEAWFIATREGVRTAFKSIVIERITDRASGEPKIVEVRQLHAIRDDNGERVYKPLDIIRQSDKDLQSLVRDLRTEAESYARKMTNILMEVEAALGG
jgi:hypothetical protein